MSELVAMVMTMAAAAAAARRFASFSCAYASPVKHAVAACMLLKKQGGHPLSLVLLQWGSLCHLRPPVTLKNLGREIRGQCFSTDVNTKTVPVAVISTHKVMAVNVGALLKVIFFLSPNGLSASAMQCNSMWNIVLL